MNLIAELQAYGAEVFVHDPVADAADAMKFYGVELIAWDDLPQADALVVAVAHHAFTTISIANYCFKINP